MDHPRLDDAQRSPDGRLDSWKKIASYLKRDVTTVQRWEKREGMPVHRQLHDKLGSVYAFRAELDAWTQRRSEQSSPAVTEPEPDDAAMPAAPPRSKRMTSGRRLWAVATLAAIALLIALVLDHRDYFWRNPLAGAAFRPVTGFDGENEDAAVSRDGRFVAFLSDRSGRTDVWVTQIGSGQFHNLTQGMDGELVNPSIRTLGFSPDGAQVAFWLRRKPAAGADDISIWTAPMLGGEPKPYLEGVAEVAWSPDGHQIVYHTPRPGDPFFVSGELGPSREHSIFTAPAGLHSHFPIWAYDHRIYFVQGTLPDQLDIWRVDIRGEHPEKITSHNARVSYPLLLNQRTLLYLASEPDGSGSAVFGMDVEKRIPHRLTNGVEQYTSLAASADGHRVVATVSEPQPTLWRVSLGNSDPGETPQRIALSTGNGSAPRRGPDYMVFVAASGTADSLWKMNGAATMQLWSDNDARIMGSPAVSADGTFIAFSVRQSSKTLLYVMRSDGSGIRVVNESLQLRGSPAFEPGGNAVDSAVDDQNSVRLMRIPLDNQAPTVLLSNYALDPAWSSDAGYFIYSGPDIGTKFALRAATASGADRALPPFELTRGARHLALLPGGKLIYLQGELHHKNLWSAELESGVMRQLTDLPQDFDVRDFDVSSDGQEAILERAQSRSHVVLIERASF